MEQISKPRQRGRKRGGGTYRVADFNVGRVLAEERRLDGSLLLGVASLDDGVDGLELLNLHEGIEPVLVPQALDVLVGMLGVDLVAGGDGVDVSLDDAVIAALLRGEVTHIC